MGQRKEDRLLRAASEFVDCDAWKQLFSVVACHPCKLQIGTDRLGFAWQMMDDNVLVFQRNAKCEISTKYFHLSPKETESNASSRLSPAETYFNHVWDAENVSIDISFFKKPAFVTSPSLCWAENAVSASPIWEFNAFWWRLCCRPSQAEPVFVIKQNEITASKWKAWLIFSADTVCGYAKACLTLSQQIQ